MAHPIAALLVYLTVLSTIEKELEYITFPEIQDAMHEAATFSNSLVVSEDNIMVVHGLMKSLYTLKTYDDSTRHALLILATINLPLPDKQLEDLMSKYSMIVEMAREKKTLMGITDHEFYEKITEVNPAFRDDPYFLIYFPIALHYAREHERNTLGERFE